MDSISEVTIGEVVYVKLKDDRGPVTDKTADTLTVHLLSGRVVVREGEFERRP